jgi:hypothetical protein
MKVHLKKTNLKETLNYFTTNWSEFILKITNYTMEVNTGDKKYFFSTQAMSKKVFIWYSIIKKSNGGETREVPKNYKYYDFSGIEKLEKITEPIFCIDINSAYLSVLVRDKILSQKDFDLIQSRASKKHRLQSVGMFAKNPISIGFKNGVPIEYKTEADPFKWIFYHSVNETFLGMDKVKKGLLNDFLFYWVDGIFIKGDPSRAVQILKNCGFESKIEEVKNFRIKDKYLVFDKFSNSKKVFEKKILFLPQDRKMNKEEKKDLISQIKRAKKI